MYIQSITLRNIRSYVDETITFSKGITLLAGDIGSGKSSILQAIEFAFFGAQRGQLDGSTLLRHGAGQGEVILKIFLDSEITITRTLKQTKQGVTQTVGSIEYNGVKEDYASSELRARILALLGYPDTTSPYRYTVYASQEQMKQIIQEKPSNRLDTLRVIFGVDKYKQIIDNVEIIQRYLRKEKGYYEGKLEDFTAKKAALADLQLHIENVQKELESIPLDTSKHLFEKAKEKRDLAQKEFETYSLALQEKNILESRSSLVEAYTDKIQKVSSELSSIQTSVVVIPEFDNFALQKMRDLVSQQKVLLAKLEEKKEQLQKKISSVRPKLLIEADRAATRKNIEQLQSDISDLNLKLANWMKQKERLSQIKQQYAELQEHIKSISGKTLCPTCGQTVDAEHVQKMTREANDNLGIIRNEELSLGSTIKDPSAELAKAQTSLQQILIFESKLESELQLAQDSEYLAQELLLVHSKIETLRSHNSFAELCALEEQEKMYLKKKQEFVVAQNSILEKKKILSETQILLDSEIKEQEKITTRLAELSKIISIHDPSSLSDANISYTNYLNEFQVVQKKYSSLQTELRLLSMQRDSLSQEVNEKKIAFKNYQWTEVQQSWFKQFFVPVVSRIEKYVLGQIYVECNNAFSEWFMRLIEDESFTAQLDFEFTPRITQNGYDIDVDSLSGGERTSVAFAYRLALFFVVNQLLQLKTKSLLILDEPTEGFSTEQLDRVREVLRSLSAEQIFIVSHEQKLESFAESVIRVQKTGAQSKIFVDSGV